MNQNEIERLIYLFSKLPGFGPRSSRRAVLHLIKYKESLMLPLAESIKSTAQTVKTCIKCFNLDVNSPCKICNDTKRDQKVICIVETIADLWAIEKGNIFRGTYHVLGGNLSAFNNISPEDLHIDHLLSRIKANEITEVILATNSNVEGQTTAYYITEKLTDSNVKISMLAHGIPIGGELDYLDEGTLNAAFKARQPF